MPRCSATASDPSDSAIRGSAVTMTVPSRNSMKNAPATSRARRLMRRRYGFGGRVPSFGGLDGAGPRSPVSRS